jgi:hypothetical protein
MNAVPATSPAVDTRTGLGAGVERALFVCTVILAGALFWIAAKPGMGDLPQHVAQVTLLRDLLDGTSPWQHLVYINYVTPYLTGYLLALVLSYVMPVLTGMKLLLMVSYYAFVVACVLLRKRFAADARLDWLFVPGFFGVAFQFGFYTFLVATPLALFFILLARRFAETPTLACGFGLFIAGVGIFFSHGLVFLFACAIGAAFVLIRVRGIARLAMTLTPYALLGAVALAYMLYARHHALITWSGQASTPVAVVWDWQNPWGWHRLYNFLLYVFASQMKDWYFLPGGVFMLAAPWLMQARLKWREPVRLVPMIAVLVLWFLVPSDVLDVNYLYQRFALYLLPAYALMFAYPEGRARPDGAGSLIPILTQAVLVLICWSFLGVLAVREHRFAVENESFETLLSVTEPGQRALNLVYATESPIIHNQYTYHSYPLWYQAEQKGFVDFNFAFALPQIVRFRPDQVPAMRPGLVKSAETFDWHAVQGHVYRYFFVRHVAPLPAHLFDNDECQVVLLKEAGEWSLFERRTCH